MNWANYRLVPFDEIDFDRDDIRARSKRADVAELADSIRRLGDEPMEAVVVEVNPPGSSFRYRLVAGRDRTAACWCILKHAAAWAHVGEDFAPGELETAEIEENLRRRSDNRDELLARYVAIWAREIRGRGATAVSAGGGAGIPASHPPSGKENPPPPSADTGRAARKPGRPVTVKGEARAIAAKAAGVTVEAVRSAEKRVAAKAAVQSSPSTASVPVTVNVFGLPVEGDVREAATRAYVHQQDIDEMSNALEQAQKWLNKANDATAHAATMAPSIAKLKPFTTNVAKLHDSVKHLAGEVRGQRPTALCPFCKGSREMGDVTCSFCRGLAYATADDMKAAGIPAELLREGGDAMVSDGRGWFVLLAKVATKGAAPVSSPAPKGKKPPKDADRLEPVPVPSAAPGSAKGSRLRGNGAGQAGDKPAHAQVLTSAKAMPGQGVKPGDDKGSGGAMVAGEIPVRPAFGHETAPPPPKSPFSPSFPGKKRRPLATCGTCGADLFEDQGCGCPTAPDPTRPTDEQAYSGADAPVADLPELALERDEDWT